jgi:type IV pilus assembly protein PilQ
VPTTLLLTGAPQDIARVREILTKVDIKQPQIVFEAKVVEVSNDDLDQFGLSYDFSRTVQIGENNIPPGTARVGPETNEGTGRPVNFGTIFRTPYSVGVQLNALVSQGRSRVLANPNVSTLDGMPAVVFIGDQVRYVVNIQQTPQGQTVITETATVGITLQVTGKTSPDGSITLYIHPEVSVISSFLEVGNGIALPQIATRFVDTTARVKDGETIAIGGLLRESELENLRKVPFLGDLPFFGKWLFTQRSKEKTNTNLMVFITSRIVKE